MEVVAIKRIKLIVSIVVETDRELVEKEKDISLVEDDNHYVYSIIWIVAFFEQVEVNVNEILYAI